MVQQSGEPRKLDLVAMITGDESNLLYAQLYRRTFLFAESPHCGMLLKELFKAVTWREGVYGEATTFPVLD